MTSFHGGSERVSRVSGSSPLTATTRKKYSSPGVRSPMYVQFCPDSAASGVGSLRFHGPSSIDNNGPFINTGLTNATSLQPGTERVQSLADISHSALCCHSNETREFLISWGSVATYLRWGGYCRMGFFANFIRFPAVQNLWKSIKIWQSYRQLKRGNFFETRCICYSVQ